MSNIQIVQKHEIISNEKINLLKDQICKGATDSELQLFITNCNRTGLDPFQKQCWAVKRWDSSLNREVMAFQTGVDGFRVIANRSEKYAGQLGPYWCGPDGVWKDVWIENIPPVAAKAGVLRSDFKEPLWAVARFSSYAAKTKSGDLTKFWITMPDLMIAKCFDEHTEVLTTQGFELFSKVKGKILQVTEHGLEISDSKPFAQQYTGEMVTYDSDDLNFSVTPNHDMITTFGKIEAYEMYMQSRSRASFWIPRIVPANEKEQIKIDDDTLRLAAFYLADGSDMSRSSFRIEVSREHKVLAIENLNLHHKKIKRLSSGNKGMLKDGRIITTKKDKYGYFYKFDLIKNLILPGKQPIPEIFLKLSQRQAKIFVDSLLQFDGNFGSGGGVSRTARFYCSNPIIQSIYELTAIIAGYAVGPAILRHDKKNKHTAVSSRDAIPVFKRNSHSPSLEITQNQTHNVWCVTVPSGAIVVRRFGFSMICGNCAEAMALRKAFPQDLSGIYSSEEMDQANEKPVEAIQEKIVEKPAKLSTTPLEVKKAKPVNFADKLILDAGNYEIKVGRFTGKKILDIPTSDIQKAIAHLKSEKEKNGLIPDAAQEFLDKAIIFTEVRTQNVEK